MAGTVLERLALLLESGAAPAAEEEAAMVSAVGAFEQKLTEVEEAVTQGGYLPGALARYIASAFSALPAPSVWQAVLLSQAGEALAGRSPLHKEGGAATNMAMERRVDSRLYERAFAPASLPGKPGNAPATPGERRVIRDAGCFTLPPRPGNGANEARNPTAANPPGFLPGTREGFSLPGVQPIAREPGQNKGAEGRAGQVRVPESLRQENTGQGRDILASLARVFMEIAAASIRLPAPEEARGGVFREEGTVAAWLSGHARRMTPAADETPRVASAGIFSFLGKDGTMPASPAPAWPGSSGGSAGSEGWGGPGVAAAFLLSGQLPPDIAANLVTARKVVELTRTPLAASFVKSVAGSRVENKSITTTVSEVVVKTPESEPEPDKLFTRTLADEIESLVAEFDDGIWA